MKTIQPNMRLDKQVRKGTALTSATIWLAMQRIGDVDNPLPEHELQRLLERARYTINLVDELVTSYCNGEPRPWSEFSPRLVEEFGTEQLDHTVAEDAFDGTS